MADRRDTRGAPEHPWRYVSVGLTVAGSTLVFVLLGRAADGRLGSAPWLTLAGALVGAGAGFWYMYRELVIRAGRAGRGNEE